MSDLKAKAEAFRIEVKGKIDKLLQDFTEGKVSREQFHLLYERYNNHLAIADEAAVGLNPDQLDVVQGGLPTYAIKSASKGRALGLGIYHHRSGLLIETLGNFEVSADVMTPVLNEFSLKLEKRELIDNHLKKYGHFWLLFAAGQYTTVITLFKNEPAPVQVQQIERMHHDFETANRVLLNVENVDTSKLAYPFIVFVQKKLQNQ
jgi:hypothetical protein